MPVSIAKATESANLPIAEPCGERRNTLRTNVIVMQRARGLFPNKTALHLSEITGYSVRAVEYWLAGKTRLPADALASLLHSDFGREFLDAVMDNARPAWWMRVAAFFKLADASELQAKARRKMKAVLYADQELEDRLEQGEAAALHQDEGFYRAHFEMRRQAARPVARRGRR